MAHPEVAQVYTPEQVKSAKDVTSGGKEESKSKLFDILKKVFYGVSLEKTEKELGVIQQRAEEGLVDEADQTLLGHLKKVVVEREKTIAKQVGEINEKVKAGDTPEAQRLAAEFLNNYGRHLQGTPEGDEKFRQLSDLVRGVVDTSAKAEELPEGVLGPDDEKKMVTVGFDILNFRDEAKDKGYTEDRADNVLKKIDRVMTTARKKAAIEGEEGLQAILRRARERDERPSTQGKLRDRHTLEVALGQSGITGNKERATMETVDAFNSGDVERLWEGERGRESTLGPKDKQDLAQLTEMTSRSLREVKNNMVFQEIGNGIDRKAVTVHVAGEPVEISLVGSARSRVEQISSFLTGDPANRDREIGYIRSASGVNQEVAERTWDRLAQWQTGVGEFEKSLERLSNRMYGEVEGRRTAQEVGLLGRKGIEEELGDEGLFGVRSEANLVYEDPAQPGEMRRTSWARARQAELAGIAYDPESEWRTATTETKVAEFRERARRGYADAVAGRAREFGGYGRFLPPEAATWSEETVRDRIRETVFTIMRTQESSRDPKNQTNTWTLYELYSLANAPADAIEKWTAVLALYDVSMFMGSVEDYEQWAKVTSFMWKEAWEVLEDQKEVLVTDRVGEEVTLGFKEIQTLLELRTSTEKAEAGAPINERRAEARNVWLAEIMKSGDLTELGINKRRFLAVVLANRMGLNLEIRGRDKKLEFVPREGQDVNAELQRRMGVGKKGFMRLLGLDEDGVRLLTTSETTARGNSKQYVHDEHYDADADLYGDYLWYINNTISFMHMTNRSVEIERGGDGKFWKYMPNILRKLHGNAMYHYYNQKGMGLNPFLRQMRVVDSFWRSIYGWRIDMGKGVFTKDFADTIFPQFGNDRNAKRDFNTWFMRAVTTSEQEQFGFGNILSVSEIRDRENVEKALKEYKFGNVEWRDVLKRLGMSDTQLNGNTRGAAGARLFLENFSYGLFNYDSLDHNTMADYVKYTGVSNKWFNEVQNFINHPNHGNIKALQDILTNYHGLGENTEKKAGYLMDTYFRATRTGWEYETFKTKDEAGVGPSANAVEEYRENGDRKERQVYDEDGNVVYATEKVKWTDGLLSINRPHSKGMPMGRRGYPAKPLVHRKQELYDLLREGALHPGDFNKYMARWRANAWLGIDWDRDESFLQAVGRQPLKSLLWVFYIPRGFLVDVLGLKWSELEYFFAPGKEEVKKAIGMG